MDELTVNARNHDADVYYKGWQFHIVIDDNGKLNLRARFQQSEIRVKAERAHPELPDEMEWCTTLNVTVSDGEEVMQ